MKINDIIKYLESIAHPSLQESYDNAGLIMGDKETECRGILCCLDSTEAIVQEAIDKGCNLIIAHHPIVFAGLKKFSGNSYVERTVRLAIRNDIAIYSIHTNLDNVLEGVSGHMAKLLGLQDVKVLSPRPELLRKLVVFVPTANLEQVRTAAFEAGAGVIGNYDSCSFSSPGSGTFRAGEATNPFVGERGKLHAEQEIKLEMIMPSFKQEAIIAAIKNVHPYEEPAIDILQVIGNHQKIGSGVIGEFETAMDSGVFLSRLREIFKTPSIRHTAHISRPIRRVALCGGAGSFLISKALGERADAFVTADLKYHEFFDADGRMLVADIGHYESEQFTIDLLQSILEKKFPTFAVLKTEIVTNPVNYF